MFDKTISFEKEHLNPLNLLSEKQPFSNVKKTYCLVSHFRNFETIDLYKHMDYSDSFQLACDFVQYTNTNIFLTGKAGTGKTTFLKYCKENIKKNTAVVAPTGVAAMNAGGTTIHSFFQLPFNPFIPASRMFNGDESVNDKNSLLSKLKLNSERREVMRNLELLIIDEISMVRCDLLDAIDTVLRHVRNQYSKAFGGVQVLFIGDMYQLPPVVKDEEWQLLTTYYKSQYFFNSQVMESEPAMFVTLEKIYRQNDPAFINVLNQVRNNEMDQEGYELLHRRYIPDFEPLKSDNYITLTTHNHKADAINTKALQEISSKENVFTAAIEGEFYEKSFPADLSLKLKVGAQVMFIKNDTEKIRRYFNGKIGIVEKIEEDKITVSCKGDDLFIEVSKEKWKNIKYSVDKTTNLVEENEIGSFTQYPLRLAWAITIHKSQGLTFERAVIDAVDAFTAGQVYVALSRCTNLEGMVLRSRITNQSLKSDQRIVDFSNSKKPVDLQLQLLKNAKIKYQSEQIKELFDFVSICNNTKDVYTFILKEKESFNTQAITAFEGIQQLMINTNQTAEKFELQLNNLLSAEIFPEKNEMLQSRVKAAAQHFMVEAGKIKNRIENLAIETDSKTLANDLYKILQRLYDEMNFKCIILKGNLNGFAIDEHLQIKKAFKKTALQISIYSGHSTVVKTDIAHPELYNMLKKKRDEICKEKNQPVYLIAKSSTLEEMALYLPQTITQLNLISGFGPVKSRQYGKEFLDIICEYCEVNDMESSIETKIPKAKVSRKRSEPSAVTKTSIKPDTKSISFDLFKKGKTIDEISLERNITNGTVEQHLSHFIATGEIELNALITSEKINLIRSAIEIHGNTSAKKLKENLPEHLGYGEIRMVMAALAPSIPQGGS